MKGEVNLSILLREMCPILQPEEFVFCPLPADTIENALLIKEVTGLFKEEEGLTVILKKNIADSHRLAYHYIARQITLSIHSSLDAVGFLAVVTQELAKHNISVNPISAYYHDHLFVPSDQAEVTMTILNRFSQEV